MSRRSVRTQNKPSPDYREVEPEPFKEYELTYYSPGWQNEIDEIIRGFDTSKLENKNFIYMTFHYDCLENNYFFKIGESRIDLRKKILQLINRFQCYDKPSDIMRLIGIFTTPDPKEDEDLLKDKLNLFSYDLRKRFDKENLETYVYSEKVYDIFFEQAIIHSYYELISFNDISKVKAELQPKIERLDIVIKNKKTHAVQEIKPSTVKVSVAPNKLSCESNSSCNLLDRFIDKSNIIIKEKNVFAKSRNNLDILLLYNEPARNLWKILINSNETHIGINIEYNDLFDRYNDISDIVGPVKKRIYSNTIQVVSADGYTNYLKTTVIFAEILFQTLKIDKDSLGNDNFICGIQIKSRNDNLIRYIIESILDFDASINKISSIDMLMHVKAKIEFDTLQKMTLFSHVNFAF